MFRTSNETDQLFKALFDFQKECPTIEKKASGGFKGTKYADRTDVIQEIRPFLTKNSLFFIQAASSGEEDHIGMSSRIVHASSNQWIEITEYRAAGRIEKGLSQPQADGCVLTYMSRQQLVYLLGIPLVGEDDEKSLSHYGPLPPKPFPAPKKDLSDEEYRDKGHKLLNEMSKSSERSWAIDAYCIKNGYSHWAEIPARNFREDKDLHMALKKSGEYWNSQKASE